MMGWNNTGSWGAGHWLAMSLMMIIVWGLVVAVVIWLVRSARSGRSTNEAGTSIPTQDVREVSAQRFARDQIDEQEFTKRRKALPPTGDHFVTTRRR